MSALHLRDVRVAYGDVVAVDAASLVVERGEVHAILGASGAGKTSLLRAVAGFERVSAGVVSVGGRVVDDGASWHPPERRNVGVVFQDYALFPHMSVRANIAYGMRPRSDAAIDELLATVGLEGKGARRPAELSGGEQQRVALARALAQKPDLLLLDEPFAHLDPARREALRDETVAIVRRSGVAAIVVTHDADDALACADLVHVMHRTRVLQSGAPRSIYEAPVDATVARAVGPAQLVPCTGDGERVETPLGTVAVGSGAGAFVVLRPEYLELHGPGSDRGAPGRVVGRSFRGGDLELRVDVAGFVVAVRVRPWEAPEQDEVRVAVGRPCARVDHQA